MTFAPLKIFSPSCYNPKEIVRFSSSSSSSRVTSGHVWLRNPGKLRVGYSCKATKRMAFWKGVETEGGDGNIEQFLENNAIADFMRFQGNGEDHDGKLQTAIVSYKKRFPWSLLQPFLQVDLVSTIHIADKEYFATLQKELETYDRVLYEMVASRENLESRRNARDLKSSTKLKGSRSRGFNILGCIQRQMARALALDFQLDCLDYQGDKWYHADLDFETFKLLQLERGESFFTFARDMTIRSTKAIVQPATVPEELGPWRSKLLWASRVLPMPLVGLLIIGSVCAPADKPSTEYPEWKALSRLDFGAAMKVFLAKRLTTDLCTPAGREVFCFLVSDCL
ncbi:uncharacterized protein LOC18426596 isoform X2 [Amborella trichopoda]|uniref:uncharacterized protein LOC18426596 isoform X2 n=1 Tax=Amborella trichopoda TaxID=13333 RepID=UPI0009BE5EF1|nr:uncharacterized protein LOC18426596 isoform X2 [Amborella trichopoda]|eukprot:XP_020518301.1 uncharacterized protein LOC18426596 isoform X2 [Amborella trichopoda]